MSDMWWSRGVGCGLVVVLAVGLVACRGGEEPTPAPSGSGASPTVEASPSLGATVDEQELIDEAIAALTEYLALANEVENAGGEGWEEKLKPWWGNDELIESATSHFTTMLELGIHTEGSSEIVQITTSRYETPTGVVYIEYCLLGKDARVVDASGQDYVEVPNHAFPAQAELSHNGERWLFLGQDTQREEQC